MSENRETFQKQLAFIDTIEKNLHDVKYERCKDFIGEINNFLIDCHRLTRGESDIREKVSSLLDFSNQIIDEANLN